MGLKSDNPYDDLNGGMAEENPQMAECVGSDGSAQSREILPNEAIINNINLYTLLSSVKSERTDSPVSAERAAFLWASVIRVSAIETCRTSACALIPEIPSILPNGDDGRGWMSPESFRNLAIAFYGFFSALMGKSMR
ncbi:MAG: hypothetical protein NTZ39_04755 [Methanoregula sp.]|nr:hypothetical protein [Methanoregula sp.]